MVLKDSRILVSEYGSDCFPANERELNTAFHLPLFQSLLISKTPLYLPSLQASLQLSSPHVCLVVRVSSAKGGRLRNLDRI